MDTGMALFSLFSLLTVCVGFWMWGYAHGYGAGWRACHERLTRTR